MSPQPAAIQPEVLSLSLAVTDREVVAALLQHAEGRPRDDFARQALRIGVLALEQARGRVDAVALRNEGDRLVEEVSRALAAHQRDVAERVAQALGDYFHPESGRFSERVQRLVSKDGELEGVLRRLVGQQDSELSRTLASHLGDGSSVMRALDPQSSSGVVMTLHRTVEAQLQVQRDHFLAQFSLDRPESALARLVQQVTSRHGDLEKSLRERIDEVVREFSLDKKDSALSRLVASVGTAQERITKEFTLDNSESALARMRDELLRQLEKQAKDGRDFQSEVRATLEALNARRAAEARSTTHGTTFQDALRDVLRAEAERCHDVFEVTANQPGQIQRNKKGDFVIRLGADCRAAGAGVVVEAKESGAYDLKAALAEIDEARRNRACEVGLFVWSRKSASESTPALARHGDDIVVTWDADDPASDAYLKAGYSLGRALCTRAVGGREQRSADFGAMDKAIRAIEKHCENLSEIQASAHTIKSGSEKILKRVEIDQEGLRRQVAALDGLLQDLRDDAALA